MGCLINRAYVYIFYMRIFIYLKLTYAVLLSNLANAWPNLFPPFLNLFVSLTLSHSLCHTFSHSLSSSISPSLLFPPFHIIWLLIPLSLIPLNSESKNSRLKFVKVSETQKEKDGRKRRHIRKCCKKE